MPEARSKLEKTSDELTKLLERISGKEKVINKNFAHIVDKYKVSMLAILIGPCRQLEGGKVKIQPIKRKLSEAAREIAGNN